MRALSATLACGLMFGGAAAAEEAEDLPLGAGHGALLFTLGGLLNGTPTNLDQVGVGARYFINDGMAIRGAVGFNSNSQETDPDGPGDKIENSDSKLAVEAAAEFTFFRRGPVYIYGGALGQYATSSVDPDGDDNDTSVSAFTLAGVLGASYFFDDLVSLGAEYRLGFLSQTEEDDAQSAETSKTSIRTGAVGFHLGFWF